MASPLAVAEVGGWSFERVVASVIAATVAWLIWAALTFVVGTRLLPEPGTHANLGQLLRTLGFAAGPGVLLLLAVVSPIRMVVFVVTQVWMVAAMVVAVRQALDYTSTLRAVSVCLVGWVCQLLVAMTLLSVLAPIPEPEPVDARAPERMGASSVGIVRPSAVAPLVR